MLGKAVFTVPGDIRLGFTDRRQMTRTARRPVKCEPERKHPEYQTLLGGETRAKAEERKYEMQSGGWPRVNLTQEASRVVCNLGIGRDAVKVLASAGFTVNFLHAQLRQIPPPFTDGISQSVN